jgi:hypothetical protein
MTDDGGERRGMKRIQQIIAICFDSETVTTRNGVKGA